MAESENRNLMFNLVPVTSRTPQGGILSSLLFSLFIFNLYEVVEINFHICDDDAQLYTSAPNFDIIKRVTSMNENLQQVLQWANDNSLKIDPDKSQALIFGGRKCLSPPPLVLEMDTIKFSSSIKILGLVMDGC